MPNTTEHPETNDPEDNKQNHQRTTLGEKLGYPPKQREPKHSTRELLFPVFSLFLYAFPALYVAGNGSNLDFSIQNGILVVSTIIVGILSFAKLHAQSGEWEQKRNPPTLDLTTRGVPSREDIDSSLDDLLDDYKEIATEARYRDKLLLQTGYFSLGTFGLLGGVFISSPTHLKPFVSMLSSLVLLGFTIAVNSYKDSRDALWDRAGKIEGLVPEFRGVLTTFNTIRQADLRLFNTLSLSTYMFVLTVFMMVISVIAYLYTVFIPMST